MKNKPITNHHSLITNTINWIKHNRVEATSIFLILTIGLFLRLYRISEYMTFLGDEGRDAIIVRRLLVDFDPILIGPGTSIGNMYLGPLYYYLIAPFLLLFSFSPIGPSIFIALLGVVTIFFVWYTVKVFFTFKGTTLQGVHSVKIGALFAALMYAISPTVITYSRSSWNPNIMPFFSLLTIFSVWKWWKENNFKWLIVTSVSLAFVLQSHYLGLLLLPVIFLFIIMKIINLKLNGQWKMVNGNLIKYSFIGLFVLLFLMSPLVIFDFRHNFINSKAIEKFFSERQTTVSARPWSSFPKLPAIYDQVNNSLLGAKDTDLSWFFTNGSIIVFGWFIADRIDKITKKFGKGKLLTVKHLRYFIKNFFASDIYPFIILSLWIFTGLVGLGVYKQHIYDHYFGFLFPAFFIFMGGLINFLFNELDKKWKVILYLFIGYAVIVNIYKTPIKYPPNRQMQRAIEVAETIMNESKGNPYNLAVIAVNNYEDGYQYFLEKWNQPVVDIDPLNLEQTETDQLFVICEMDKSQCDPTHSPKAEIANFGWSKVEKEWSVSGVTVYRLVHTDL